MSKELIKFRYDYKRYNNKDWYYLSSMDIDFGDNYLFDKDDNAFNYIEIDKQEGFDTIYKLDRKYYPSDVITTEPVTVSTSYYADWYILNSTIYDLIINPIPVIYTSKTICKEIVQHETYYSYFISTNSRTIELKFDNNTIIAVYGGRTIYQYKVNNDKNIGLYGSNFIAKYTMNDKKLIIIEEMEDNDRRVNQLIDLETGANNNYYNTFDIFGSNYNKGPRYENFPFIITLELFSKYCSNDFYYHYNYFKDAVEPSDVLNTFLPEYELKSNDYLVDFNVCDIDDNHISYENTLYKK